MSAPVVDLGAPWLEFLPGGAMVLERDVQACTVAAVLVDGWFSARVPGEGRRRLLFSVAQVPQEDRGLLVVGAGFWWVVERVAVRGGGVDKATGLRVRRAGVSAEQAFRGEGGAS